jgi:hypothetical protein
MHDSIPYVGNGDLVPSFFNNWNDDSDSFILIDLYHSVDLAAIRQAAKLL